jgi:16S rRNA (adenine1518-N6/adenine1519-N6)-dimethyltransferase
VKREKSASICEDKNLKKKRVGFKPNKRLGQHFIKDKGIIDQIIERARIQGSHTVLEIGPGLGALTVPLASRVDHIIAVEKDPRLASMLCEKLSTSGIKNVMVLNHDILKLDFNDISEVSAGPIQVIGNLPYNISSPFLERLITYRNLIQKAVLMFQAEFAQRLVASPGTRVYGAITVLIRYHAQITQLLDIPKDVFYPKPKIDSMVLAFDMGRPHPRRADDEALFKKVVKSAFAQRRKTILNSLKGSLINYTIDEIADALNRCSIEQNQRAETLDIDTFICLASVLKKYP